MPSGMHGTQESWTGSMSSRGGGHVPQSNHKTSSSARQRPPPSINTSNGGQARSISYNNSMTHRSSMEDFPAVYDSSPSHRSQQYPPPLAPTPPHGATRTTKYQIPISPLSAAVGGGGTMSPNAYTDHSPVPTPTRTSVRMKVPAAAAIEEGDYVWVSDPGSAVCLPALVVRNGFVYDQDTDQEHHVMLVHTEDGEEREIRDETLVKLPQCHHPKQLPSMGIHDLSSLPLMTTNVSSELHIPALVVCDMCLMCVFVLATSGRIGSKRGLHLGAA